MAMNLKKAAELTLGFSPAIPARSDAGDTLQHAAWMLVGIKCGYITGEKAHRWLGYAQGLMVADRCLTLQEAKDINWKAENG